MAPGWPAAGLGVAAVRLARRRDVRMSEPGDGTERTMVSRAAVPSGPVDASVVHALLLEAEGTQPSRFALGDTALLVGRVAPAAIVLEGGAVSRRHCMVDRVGDQVRVTDLGSTNGTYVDAVRVVEPVFLADGAVIQIGAHRLRYERRRREEAAAAASFASDLARARDYVNALLPPPIA